MGKVDRRALPVPDEVDSEPEEAYVAPRTPIEEELSKMWAEVLGVEQVGVYDNFFALGGHSLLAAQLMARIRDAFLVELSLRDLFDTPTVGGLATTITGSLAGQEEDEELTHLLAELEELSEEEVHHQLTLPQVSKPAGG
jgi:acyl carrier protein